MLSAFVAYWEMKEEETNQILMPQTFSELIRIGFENYIERILANHPEIQEKIKDFTTEDHLTFLRNRGLKTPERERYRRSVKKALEDEDLRMDFDTTREAYVAEDYKEKFQLSKEDLKKLEQIKKEGGD